LKRPTAARHAFLAGGNRQRLLKALRRLGGLDVYRTLENADTRSFQLGKFERKFRAANSHDRRGGIQLPLLVHRSADPA
jgi:hypothetical protein